MATFIPGGGNAWTDFGQGLGKGLQQLAEIKMEQMQQRHKQHQTEQAWGAVPGIDKTLAHALALADPKDRNTILSAYLSNTPEQQQGQQQDGLANQLQGLRSNQQYQTDEQKALQQYFSTQQRQPSGVGQQGQTQQPTYTQGATPQGATPAQPMATPQTQVNPLTQRQKLLRAIESPPVKLHRESMEQQERLAHEREENKKGYQEQKLEESRRPYMDKIAESLRKNREQLRAYNEMEDLVKSHKIDSPAYMSALKLAGLEDYPFLLTPGSQEYNAKMLMFTPKIKEDFGARPTQWDAQQIFNRLATLYHSDEGKLKILSSGKKQVQSRNAIEEAKRDIIKENGKRIPSDIGLQADERAQDKIAKLYEAYKKDLGINVDWNNPELAPSRYKEGTVIEIEGKDYKLVNGTWV